MEEKWNGGGNWKEIKKGNWPVCKVKIKNHLYTKSFATDTGGDLKINRTLGSYF